MSQRYLRPDSFSQFGVYTLSVEIVVSYYSGVIEVVVVVVVVIVFT